PLLHRLRSCHRVWWSPAVYEAGGGESTASAEKDTGHDVSRRFRSLTEQLCFGIRPFLPSRPCCRGVARREAYDGPTGLRAYHWREQWEGEPLAHEGKVQVGELIHGTADEGSASQESGHVRALSADSDSAMEWSSVSTGHAGWPVALWEPVFAHAVPPGLSGGGGMEGGERSAATARAPMRRHGGVV
ncbi:MAG: hypothetical protein JXA57_04580, partial [Armatimonadetes bacterium]|nr:hypothetical protein [Armatimonadota bacterium]